MLHATELKISSTITYVLSVLQLAKMSLDPAKRPHVGPKRSSTQGGTAVAPPAAAVNVETKNEAPAAAQNIPAPAQTVITKEVCHE